MIEISIERFTELCQAEQEAKQFKKLIEKKRDEYDMIDLTEIKLLYALYCIPEETEEEEC